MMKILSELLCLIVVLLLNFQISFAQGFTNWITGDPADFVSTNYKKGLVLAGGATDNDDAMKWMLQRAGDGDVLVIRASGSDGYNDYFYAELGVNVNSVETILFESDEAATNNYVLQRIQEAEILFIAGGDQFNYYQFWKDTPVEDAINALINEKQITIGGTSAGMAVLGNAYYTPSGSAVDTEEALSNPFHPDMDILGYNDFLNIPYFSNVVTDTHYDQRDRSGRHFTFIARLAHEHQQRFFGIASNDFTAVCIDENGTAVVFGEYPDYEDYAYFLQSNCQSDFLPETIIAENPLTWNRNQAAIKTYRVPGKVDGANSFNLNTWESGTGGAWENWYAINGALQKTSTTESGCGVLISNTQSPGFKKSITVFPNPVKELLHIQFPGEATYKKIQLQNIIGQAVWVNLKNENELLLDMRSLPKGLYFLLIEGSVLEKIVKH